MASKLKPRQTDKLFCRQRKNGKKFSSACNSKTKRDIVMGQKFHMLDIHRGTNAFCGAFSTVFFSAEVGDAARTQVASKIRAVLELNCVDHRMQLFPMVANHRSSDAMFAMYRSSLANNYLFPFVQAESQYCREWMEMMGNRML